jgi:hypothetical protein
MLFDLSGIIAAGIPNWEFADLCMQHCLGPGKSFSLYIRQAGFENDCIKP